MSFLFAYGSLRTAAGHAEVRRLVARLKPIGCGRLPGRLYYLGRYPGAVFDETATEFVVGDVFELADDALLAQEHDALLTQERDVLLAALDTYEGYDPDWPDAGEYLRRQQAVEVAGLGAIDCWLYELRHVPASAIAIDGGDYVAWLKHGQG